MHSETSDSHWNPALRPNSEQASHISPSLQGLVQSESENPDEILEQHEKTSTLELGGEIAFGEISNKQNSKDKVQHIKQVESLSPREFFTPENNEEIALGLQHEYSEIAPTSLVKGCITEPKAGNISQGILSNKHNSTTSFAQTISEEVTWTDDEVDPERSSYRTDSSPVDAVNHTNKIYSFPQVPIQCSVEEFISSSQVEIKQDARDFIQDEDNMDMGVFSRISRGPPNHDSQVNSSNSDFHQSHEEGFEDPRKQYHCKDELADMKEVSQVLFESDPTRSNYFVDETREQTKISNLAGKAGVTYQEQRLEPRFEIETTFQVLESECHGSNNQVQDILGKQSLGTAQTIMKKETNDSYASDSVFLPQNSGDSNDPAIGFSRVIDKENWESENDDLAARWKAALGEDIADDSFLDEDGFLSDDELNVEITLKNKMDPAALFESDDEGFLPETEDNFSVQKASSPIQVTNSNEGHGAFTSRNLPDYSISEGSGNFYVPTTTKTTIVNPSSYTPQTVAHLPPPKPQLPDILKAKSFASMPKGGYSSPYDLPMDILPKKHVSGYQKGHVTSLSVATPPRSPSMLNQPSITPIATLSQDSSQKTSHQQIQSANSVKTSQNGFFEDLPPSKPKSASRRSGASNSISQSLYHQPSPNSPSPAALPYQHFSPLSQQHPVLPSNSQPATPLHIANVPVPSHAAPPQNLSHSLNSIESQIGVRHHVSISATHHVSANIRSHQPRTSSPLAYPNNIQDTQLSAYPRTNFDQKSAFVQHSSMRQLLPASEINEGEQTSYPEAQTYSQPIIQLLPNTPLHAVSQQSQGISPTVVGSPLKRSYSSNPSQNHVDGASMAIVPPQRSRTQSPGSAHPGRPYILSRNQSFQRPASVEPPFSSPNSTISHPLTQIAAIGSLQDISKELHPIITYISPTDGHEHDPLQRWKGSPIFAWGVGGTIVTSFPKDVPRYGINQSAQMIFRSPGVIKIQNIKQTNPLSLGLAKFPGPLRGKSKKKEVIAWLTSGIERLESDIVSSRLASSLSHESKRIEEKILLWKILRIFIEHDGILEGTLIVEKAVRLVLCPELDEGNVAIAPLYATGAELSGISQSATIPSRAEIVDSASIDNLRRYLLLGKREKAVWEAVDKRLWAHAILISNTVSRDLYRQVAQEFIQKEVKVIGEKTQSLAALYEIFAGNFEESIDELVSPSARAGFQMVSTSSEAGPSNDGLNGLDRWRETLSLVLSNRSTEDTRALTALGKLLAGYGRTEAAHICFLFARNLSVFSGIDDPLTNIVLVGSDHSRQPHDFDTELEPILLSEVFEYGMSLSNPSAIVVSSPHLSVYKLQYAKVLAEYGLREKALQYCETIAASITSQTRRSPYHHNLLISELDDLSKRLKQSPKDDSSSWISKPSIDKAKGSVWATFNKFVAGDETDATEAVANLGNSTDSGPFARIAGETPVLSKSSSSVELPSFYNSGLSIGNNVPISVAPASSRYAPSTSHTTGFQEPHSASSYGSQAFQSFEGRNLNEFRPYEPQRQNLQIMDDTSLPSQPINHVGLNALQTNFNYAPQSASFQQPVSTPFYESTSTKYISPVSQELYTNLPSEKLSVSDYHPNSIPQTSYQPNYSGESSKIELPSYDYQPSVPNGHEPAKSVDSGFQSSNFDPSSYLPPVIDDKPDSPVETLPTEKLLIDDEDDVLAPKPKSTVKEKTKAEKDRETDEAFRRAAEADAKKDQESTPVKRGWGLTSWFGGSSKKEQAPTTKPIRAKLGEASSFVYDPELKRWINKKGDAELTEAKSSMPPPPKATGPPRPRNVSTQSPMPNSNPVVPVDPASVNVRPGLGRTASNGSIIPPSRPSTSMSNASSIDDLLGPPTLGRKAGARTKKKGRGYVDVMK